MLFNVFYTSALQRSLRKQILTRPKHTITVTAWYHFVVRPGSEINVDRNGMLLCEIYLNVCILCYVLLIGNWLVCWQLMEYNFSNNFTKIVTDV